MFKDVSKTSEDKPKRKIKYGSYAKDSLSKGLFTLYESVKTTYGPNGHTVLIKHPYFTPTITKDGVTVARSITSDNPFVDAGIQAIKEVAIQTNKTVGDGTTTATILAYHMFNAYKNQNKDKVQDKDIIKGIRYAIDKVNKYIKSKSVKVTEKDVYNTAMISSNGDEEISKLVSDAINAVTNDGCITIENSSDSESTLTVIPGIEISKGYVNSYFVNNESTGECIFKNPLIFVYEGRLNEINDMVHLMELTCASMAKRPLVVFADSVEADALGLAITNKLKNNLEVCVVGTPFFGDRRKKVLQDISKITGAKYVEARMNISEITKEDFGTCGKIVIGKNTTVIHEGSKQKTQEFLDYVNGIKAQIPSIINTFEQDQEKERVAKLLGGIAIIRVGGLTEPEVQEKKDRVDDALHACKAAIEGGTVIGGGKLLYNASKLFDKELSSINPNRGVDIGISIVVEAIRKPIELLFSNSGLDFYQYREEIDSLKDNESIDLDTQEVIDLRRKKIVDPCKVTIAALNNAKSVVELLISTDCIVLTNN